MLLRAWTKEDFPSIDNEKRILENWKLQLPQEVIKNGPSNNSCKDNTRWIPPLKTHTNSTSMDLPKEILEKLDLEAY